MTPTPLLRIREASREASREERRAAWLVVLVVIVAALATGMLEDDGSCGPGADRSMESR